MVVWLVDWDLPKYPSTHRTRFYRHLKKVKEKLNGTHIKYSSMSVVITDSKELADAIRQLAIDNNARKTNLYQINGGFNLLEEHEVDE